jgi:hypothetical protein
VSRAEAGAIVGVLRAVRLGAGVGDRVELFIPRLVPRRGVRLGVGDAVGLGPVVALAVGPALEAGSLLNDGTASPVGSASAKVAPPLAGARPNHPVATETPPTKPATSNAAATGTR